MTELIHSFCRIVTDCNRRLVKSSEVKSYIFSSACNIERLDNIDLQRYDGILEGGN
jgi:hypothetical protein